MNASETISGTEIGDTDIACFLAPDPDSPAHNLLADFQNVTIFKILMNN